MKQKICGLLAMLLLLSGCGSSTPTDTSPMSEDEITQMYSDPDSFKGRTLDCTAVCSTSQSTMTTACISRCGETRRTESATRS
ncbi:MAG: hypothetical protein ACLVB4_03705 [Butyricicoccus sp.]